MGNVCHPVSPVATGPTLSAVTTATEAAQRLAAAVADGRVDALCGRRRVRLLALFGSAAVADRTPPRQRTDVAVEWLTAGDVVELVGRR